jgi:putative heme-binding domain-containing protein
MTAIRFAALVALFTLPCHISRADKPIPPGVPPAVAPDEARMTLHLAGGMDAQLVAHEPMVQQPLCITFDDRGRLWVLEYLQYPIPNGLKAVEVDQYLRTRYDKVPEPPPRGPRGIDRILILDDPDDSGRYRTSKEFVSGLDLASGFAIGGDGLYVVQPPYLLFYPDKNHDDRPDGDPEVLLKGFGMEDAHAFANSLTWGPDGWLYGAQGSTVTANIRGIEFQQGVWRYHVRTRRFELFAEGGGNTWGIDFDRYGRLFAGGNTTEPLCHHVQGGYYIKGFGKHGPLHNPYSFGYINPVAHQGFLGTGLTGGLVIYQGGLFPARFDGAAIYSNLRANAVRVSRLEPSGSTFGTHFQEDFIVSTDRWFRPIKGLVGPDGALYMADWYDYNISHTDPKDRSNWYQPSRETGRIWRVVPEGTRPRPEDQWPLGGLSSDRLTELLDHPNAWYSREARRILGERRDPALLPTLAKRVRTQHDDKRALEALWALYVGGGFTDDLACEFLAHPSEHVRAWTIRLLGDEWQVDPRFNDRLVSLAAAEPSATVRSQLAATCKRLPGPIALPIVEQLAGRAEDVNDLHIPLLLWWAVEDKAVSDRARVLKLVDTVDAWNRPITRSFLAERLARRYLAEATPEGYATAARILALAPTSDDRLRLIRAMETQMDGKHLDETPGPLAAAMRPMLAGEAPDAAVVRLSIRLGLEAAYPIAARHATSRDRPPAERADFIRTMGELKRPESLAPLLRLLNAAEPASVRASALQALQRYDTPDVATAVIALYPMMPSALRAQARDLLVSRPSWSAAALSAAESGEILPADFAIDQVRRVLLHDIPELTARTEKLWGRVRPANSRQAQGRAQAVTTIVARGKGEADRGKPIATALCLTCHKLFGEGQTIGPDLSAVDRKNLDVLIRNVVDPAGVIREGYQQYVVATTDGRILSGILAENSGGKVTVLDAKGIRTPLGREEVESLKPADSSLMPEGILESLSDQDVCDLFAYLRSEPVPATTARD